MILLAKRCDPRPLPTPQTLVQKQGLRYERKVVRALKIRGCDLEHNPWFQKPDGSFCCPDIIVYELNLGRAIVVEVKLTYTPEALEKLNLVYCPIVASVTGLKTKPLVIVKHSKGHMVKFQSSFWDTINFHPPVYLWPGIGPIT